MWEASRGLSVLALAAVASIPLAEHRSLTDTVSVDGRWDTPFFRDWEPFDPELASRSGDGNSRLLIPGMLANAAVSIDVAVATGAPRPFRVVAAANGRTGPPSRLGATYGTVSLATWTDSMGHVDVRFLSQDPSVEPKVRLSWFRATHEGNGRIPGIRWLLYFLWLGLGAGLAALTIGGLRGGLFGLTVTAALTSGALAVSRLHALAALPRLVVALAISVAFALLVRRWLPRALARWVVAAFFLRLAFVLHPAFPSIDVTFHTHNVWRFRQGEVLSSVSPSATRRALSVPYPPALYALLSPIFGLRPPDDEFVLRLAMGLLEGTAPLLVYALARKGGATVEAAAAGAVASAVMPEGLLVLAKGIAANILGSWLTLLTVVAVLAGASPLIVAGVVTLVLLSHFGAALCLLGLFGVWTLWSWLGRELSVRKAVLRLVVMAIALGLAWLVYYRDVGSLAGGAVKTLGRDLQGNPSAFLHVRWLKVGRTIQDLLLKFGATPLLLAAVGLWRATTPRPLLMVVQPWILAGALLGALAILTPIPLRFEYLLMAPLAVAAGLGAERLTANGKEGRVAAAWGFALALQLAIGLLLMMGRFDLISVVMEADRLPMPLHLSGPPLTY